MIPSVYGPHSSNARQAFWDELQSHRNLWQGPWLLCGDFNVVRSSDERTSGNLHGNEDLEFSTFLADLELLDPPLNNRSYTWCNDRDVTIMARLDCFLFSLGFEDRFPFLKQIALPCIVFDHVPLILDTGESHRPKSQRAVVVCPQDYRPPRCSGTNADSTSNSKSRRTHNNGDNPHL